MQPAEGYNEIRSGVRALRRISGRVFSQNRLRWCAQSYKYREELSHVHQL